MTLDDLASVIVPNWNGQRLLADCLDSLACQSYGRLEVIVVDGGSTDGSLSLLGERYGWVRVLPLPRNRGFAGNVNAGIRASRGRVVLLLNNDAQADSEWVGACVGALSEDANLGSIASKVLVHGTTVLNSAGDTLTRAGRPVQRGNGQQDGPEWAQPVPVFGAMGGAAAYRRTMLADVGVLDERFFAYLEDLDLAFRAQLRGWGCRYVPTAQVWHIGRATGGGLLESFCNGRNLIRLLVKNVPTGLLRRLAPGIMRFQVERSLDALRAFRGSAARATLSGQCAGLRELPLSLLARRTVQKRRRVSDPDVLRLLPSDPWLGSRASR